MNISLEIRWQNMLMCIVGAVLTITTATCSFSRGEIEPYTGVQKCKGRYNDPSEDQRCYELQKRLYDAALADDVHGIKEAIKLGADVDGGFRQSLPVLEGATLDGRNKAIIFLVDAGAKINRVRAFGETALKSAVIYGHKETVKILLEKGADVCEKTESTALQYAIESGDAEMIDLLVNAGAKDCK